MSDMQRTPLEKELARMTTYTGKETSLWREALERSKKEPARTGILYSFNWRRPWLAAAVIAIVGSLATLTVYNSGRTNNTVPLLSVDRDAAPPVTAAPPPVARPKRVGVGVAGGGGENGSDPQWNFYDPTDDVPAQRLVIRKATIELAAEDVRSAYLRIMQIPSAARGEFIDDSSLTGQDSQRLHGSVTLRIAADRLPEVLNELRELGRVVSEQSKGEDVTAQHVDLEARLRNEQRIEQELLELLDSRDEAPLKDVLELRRHLEQVRGQIERLTAQREQLGRMVALATVLVIVKPDLEASQEEPTEEQSLGAYFLENLLDSGKAGMYLLADTLAVLVHLAIGGLIWWIIAFTLILAARTMWRRNAMAA